MPEGDTIWRTAAALHPRLAGRTVRRASHAGLEGRRVESVEAVGKHLLIRFEGGWVLRTHMGMTGVWYVYRPGERWRKPAWRARGGVGGDDRGAGGFSGLGPGPVTVAGYGNGPGRGAASRVRVRKGGHAGQSAGDGANVPRPRPPSGP